MTNFKPITRPGIIVLSILLFYGATSFNSLATICAVITPFILFKLTWKENESPFIFMALLLQWLSITIKVFYANFTHIDFSDLFDNYKSIERAYYYSLIGLISMGFGIHIIIRTFTVDKIDYSELALKYDSRKIVPLYIVVSLLYPIVFNYSYALGGFQQPISKLADFKWMVFFIFMLSCFSTKQYKLFGLIAGLEIILSLTGFFSNFKDYFLVVYGGFALLYFKNLKSKHVLPLASLGIALVYMVVIWQYVKPEYRGYLNGGQITQTSIRSNTESLTKLTELVSKVDRNDIEDGFLQTVNRLSYIDFFSATIDFVPNNIPHAHGRLWGDALERIIKPRIFYPNKSHIDDSETTRKYSGLQVAGAESATSISLGYVTENYIDFGVPGMFISLFLLGIIIGTVYKYVMTSSPNKLIGTAMIIPLFILVYSFESALNKVIGGLVMYVLVYELIRRFALKRFLKQIQI